MDSDFDVAQICLNGHIVNEAARGSPENNEQFCHRCGAKTVTKCAVCQTDIRGLEGWESYARPAYCHHCGKPYPWTDSALKAAQDLSDVLDGITDEDKVTLKKSLDDIVGDTPQATVAAIRFKKIVAKSGKVAAEGFKEILVNVASEAAKKVIWG